jgi:hypothetical protein
VKKAIMILAGAGTAMVFSSPATAGVPVIDPSNIAQTAKVVQNGLQQIQQLKAQVEQVTTMAKTIGSNGPLQIASDIMKKAGMDFASTDPKVNALVEYKKSMPGLIDALPSSNIGKELGISSSLAGNAKSSIEDARKFALTAFYKSGTATIDETQKRQGVRAAAMRDSVTAGYAMAVYTKNDLSRTEERLKTLSEGVSKAADLRGDVQSNSAIALAQLQAMTVQNQLLSQLLEVQATSAMASKEGMAN